MIPAVIPPLTGLSVLVTRPLQQSERLAANIREQGGEAHLLPAIEIVPLVAQITGLFDLIVFISVHAVEHGAPLMIRGEATRIAAIGTATASALEAAGLPANIVPAQGFTSESLLAHPDLGVGANSRVLIVRGRGGRELLQETFSAQGCVVETLEVYERILPALDPARLDELEMLWVSGEINVVTVTSVETLENLRALLSDRGNACLASTPLVVPSARIAIAAKELGITGDCIVASGADDQSIVTALARWHARARVSSIVAN
ncbi:MAG: uroporphyrinogen-III synthase [Povalibacter sp.]